MNEVVIGDCLTALDGVADGSIGMVFADLPYGITANKWDSEIPLDKLWGQLLRVGKENCAFVFTACQPFASRLVLSQIGIWRHEWVWIKNRGSNFLNVGREPMREHETVQVFSRGRWTYNRQMQERTGGAVAMIGKRVTTKAGSENYRKLARQPVYDSLPELRVPSSWQKFNTDTSGLHPTIKPVPLCEYMIKTYSNPGDTVLDPCCGSGSSLVAAKNLGRNYIGIELSAGYAAIARQRLDEGRQLELEI